MEVINNGKGVGTMVVSNKKEKIIDYIIIKIGNKIYSTSFKGSAKDKGCFGTIQDTNTIGIGKQKSFMIRNIPLEETNKHQKMEKINAELDIYFKELNKEENI